MSARHDIAYRRRAAMIGALASCVCTWPLDVEPTESGHHPACPAHATLVFYAKRERAQRADEVDGPVTVREAYGAGDCGGPA